MITHKKGDLEIRLMEKPVVGQIRVLIDPLRRRSKPDISAKEEATLIGETYGIQTSVYGRDYRYVIVVWLDSRAYRIVSTHKTMELAYARLERMIQP